MSDRQLLHLLQLSSPMLPVGGYSYSEGLEYLVEQKIIGDRQQLYSWIEQELRYGSIRTETAVMVRAYQGKRQEARGKEKRGREEEELVYWNEWFSAVRETKELRQQSWQMGQSLLKLLVSLEPDLAAIAKHIGNPCNYPIAFSIGAAHWQIDLETAAIAYLQSWATNLISAGVKLIPLGQTAGQHILQDIAEVIAIAKTEILALKDEELGSCGWGLTLASMAHETQYTRLFRS
ncbi:urease accessory protein UreF [Spirulina sp. 06S082]|uniref:urease accessory protein UreF n=1 Tax=Spirulina sp. 06S082 TaxID=3110248 RepID=UPI002B206163|nr:urease accessory protein UreF [Spirulina sp. 06S082]MEA5467671.1 urease accessory protein UreF [Spirulina sp. 06S082]